MCSKETIEKISARADFNLIKLDETKIEIIISSVWKTT